MRVELKTVRVGILLAALISMTGAIAAQDALPAYLQVRAVPHGTVQSVPYKSKALRTERKMIVYTPPDYAKSNTRYPVVYLLHGSGSTETSWTERGKAHVITDNLIADGRVKPMILVMPFGFAMQRAAGAGRGDASENKMQREGFAQDFIEDVIPVVDSTFRVYADRDHRAIAGLSLGGAQALAIGLTHLDLFSRIAAFSPAMGASNNPATGGVDFETVLADSSRINNQVKFLWVSCGFEDSLFDSIRDFSQQLTKHKIEHIYRVTGGAHAYPVWQGNLDQVLPMLVQ